MILAFYSCLLNQRKCPPLGSFGLLTNGWNQSHNWIGMMILDSPRGAGWSRETWVRFSFTLIFFFLSSPITHLLYPGRLSSNRKAGRKKWDGEWKEKQWGERRRQIKSNLLGWLWGCRYTPDGDPELDGLLCGNNPLRLIKRLRNHSWSNKNPLSMSHSHLHHNKDTFRE